MGWRSESKTQPAGVGWLANRATTTPRARHDVLSGPGSDSPATVRGHAPR